MKAFIFRYRWWCAAVAVIMLIVLLRLAYFALLPGEGWLHRGWIAMHDGRYADAGRCFERAELKLPKSDLPKIALITLYKHDFYISSSVKPRYGPLNQVPFLDKYLGSIADRQLLLKKGREPELEKWAHKHYSNIGVPCKLFSQYWNIFPRELKQAIAAIKAVEQGHYSAARQTLDTIEKRRPATYKAFSSMAPVLLQYQAQASWRSQYPGKADTAAALLYSSPIPPFTSPPMLTFTSTTVRSATDWMFYDPAFHAHDEIRNLLHNIRLGNAAGSTAQAWELQGNVPVAGMRSLPAPEPIRALIPGREGPQLFKYAQTSRGNEAMLWQFDGIQWRRRNEKDSQPFEPLAQLLFVLVDEKLDSAWSANAEYLTISGIPIESMWGRRQSYILRTDHGFQRLRTHTDREILCINDDLWTHSELGFERHTPDDSTTEFRGRKVIYYSAPLAGAEPQPALPFALDRRWTLVKDGQERLWLVSWDGLTLAPRAVWTGTTFRPATTQEQVAASQGFRDAAGRIWFNTELPKGFVRDAWRTVPGLPKETGAAQYAVDGKGRPWVICDGIAARWEGGHWASVADRLPGLAPRCRSIVAEGNGVMILVDGRVCYLE